MSQPNQPRHLGKNAHYPIAFRRQAVQLVESGVPQGDVVQQLGMSLSTLKGWLQQYGTVVYAHMRRKLFTPAQKHQIARELLDGRLSEEEALLKYDLRLKSTLRGWVTAFQAQQMSGPPPPLTTTAGTNEAAELAAQLRQAHWQIEALHTLIDQAEAAYHLDIRKKAGAKPSK